MNKHEILKKICEDLPTADMRGKMTNDEWYGWFEEAFDKGMRYERELANDTDTGQDKCHIQRVSVAKRTCPNCGSDKVIMFDTDNDLCQKCNKWFPGA